MNKTPPSLGFFGSPSLFSLAALQNLLDCNIVPRQIVLATPAAAAPPARVLPVSSPVQPEPLKNLARQHGIPLHYLANARQQHHLDPRQLLAVDIALVACYPHPLPARLFRWPRLACINLHPSLLPSYRGSAPVFWQLRNNETRRGVTLHHVSRELDTGPILAQKRMAYPSGASRAELDRLLAGTGTQLFIEQIFQRHKNRDALDRHPQDATRASYQRAPTSADYALCPDWSAEHAFDFMHGSPPPTDGYTLRMGHRCIVLQRAIDFSPGPAFKKPVEADEIDLRFSPGLLRAQQREPI